MGRAPAYPTPVPGSGAPIGADEPSHLGAILLLLLVLGSCAMGFVAGVSWADKTRVSRTSFSASKEVVGETDVKRGLETETTRVRR